VVVWVFGWMELSSDRPALVVILERSEESVLVTDNASVMHIISISTGPVAVMSFGRQHRPAHTSFRTAVTWGIRFSLFLPQRQSES
jgi:hypothetical protein